MHTFLFYYFIQVLYFILLYHFILILFYSILTLFLYVFVPCCLRMLLEH